MNTNPISTNIPWGGGEGGYPDHTNSTPYDISTVTDQFSYIKGSSGKKSATWDNKDIARYLPLREDNRQG